MMTPSIAQQKFENNCMKPILMNSLFLWRLENWGLDTDQRKELVRCWIPIAEGHKEAMYMLLAHPKLTEQERVMVCANLYEELGSGDHTKTHNRLLEDLAVELGMNLKHIHYSKHVSREFRLSAIKYWNREANPADALGYLYGMEVCATIIHKAIARAFGKGKGGYFHLHATAEEGHAHAVAQACAPRLGDDEDVQCDFGSGMEMAVMACIELCEKLNGEVYKKDIFK